MFSGRVTGTRTPFANAFEMPFDLLNAVLITAFFLVSAVRNIAPPAENHSLFARVLPLIALIPAPLAEAFGHHRLAVRQLYLAAAFLGFVLLFELASARIPMPTHWRDWNRRGGLARFVGRLTMPGWSSAFMFGLLMVAGWALVEFVVLSGASAAAREQARRVAWLALLAFAGIAFPAVLQSFFGRLPVPRTLLYFAGLAIPALLAGVSIALAESRWKLTEFRSVMEVVPFSSFLFAVNKTNPSSLAYAAQGGVAAAVLLVGVWQTRSYWRQLRAFEARDREVAEAMAKERDEQR